MDENPDFDGLDERCSAPGLGNFVPYYQSSIAKMAAAGWLLVV
jgi:hypothetical protein